MPADDRNRSPRGPLFPRAQEGRLLAPAEVAASLENFYATRDGSLRSIPGPTPYLPKYYGDDSRPASEKTVTDYVDCHGIFHALVAGGKRDVLLLHTGKELWVFCGWKQCWTPLISSTNPTAKISVDLHDDSSPRAPTQFVSTPNGMVIIPQADLDRKAYFYDGEVILPLGYSSIPGSPTPLGPKGPSASSASSLTANSEGYVLNSYYMNRSRRVRGKRHHKFGHGRIGTITTIPDSNHLYDTTTEPPEAPDPPAPPDEDSAAAMAIRALMPIFGGMHDFAKEKKPTFGAPHLLDGEWYGAVQWVDYFGNLSPISNRSQAIRLGRKPGSWTDSGRPKSGDELRYQFAWTGIPYGPTGTIGRIIYRTKDVINSNSGVTLFQLPASSFARTSTNRSVELALTSQFATIPENISKTFPDNIPDSALVGEALQIVPVPKFSLATVALGRLFIGNLSSDPGAVMYSLPGRWGTFEENSILFPDPEGGAITGLWKISGGLIAFTASSMYGVVPSDDGKFFRTYPISGTIGCSSPNSIAEMPNGLIIWLNEEGFYAYDGNQVAPLSPGLENEIPNFSRARLIQASATVDHENKEYICWVTTGDSLHNNRGYVFDGKGWKIRTGAKYVDLCTTKDHRRYVLGCGNVWGTYAVNFIPNVFDSEFQDDVDNPGWDDHGDAVKARRKIDKMSGVVKFSDGRNPSSDNPAPRTDSRRAEAELMSGDGPPDMTATRFMSAASTYGKDPFEDIDNDITEGHRDKDLWDKGEVMWPSDIDMSYPGVWVLNHESRNFYPNPAFRVPVFETSWVGAGEDNRKTAMTVKVWFRETSVGGKIKVSVYRDWRKTEAVEEFTMDLSSPEDRPPAWDIASGTSDDDSWQKRRPYWIRKDIYIPSCETFKLRFQGLTQGEYLSHSDHTVDSTSDIEILGLTIEELPRVGGARIPRSTK